MTGNLRATALIVKLGLLSGLAIVITGSAQAETILQFSGTAQTLSGGTVQESFSYTSIPWLVSDTTVPASALSSCLITGDTCTYVAFYPAGPGDAAGHHPQIEVGGNNGAFDYYFPYNAFVTAGTFDTLLLGNNSGTLSVDIVTPEPSSFLLLLGVGILAAAARLRRRFLPLLCLAVSIGASTLLAQTGTVLDYTTSWIGNSFGGENANSDMLMKHVPIDFDGMYVTPGGEVYTNTGWDEGGRALSTFKNGDLISPISSANQNDGGADNAGGVAMAVDDKYIYEGYTTGSGVTIKNLSDHSDANVSLTGSSTVANSTGILGMIVANKKLYVTENDFNKVEVFSTDTLSLVNSFSIKDPARVAVDSAGGMWISHLDLTVLPPHDSFGRFGTSVIDHYDSSGTWQNSITLENDGEVTALWIDKLGRLFVGDDGTDQNVKVYDNILHAPVLVGALGVKGGVYQGDVRGQRGPLRFHGITGVGTDALGNIYVSENGFGPSFPGRTSNGKGAVLESYTLGGKLNWRLQGLEFVSMGGIDPGSDSDAFDGFHHFVMDYSKPPGQEATYVGDTIDSVRFPEDVRLTNTAGVSGIVQRIQGKRFFFATDQAGGYLAIYRFEPSSEIAIPCGGLDYGAFLGTYNDWVYQPMNGEFIWRDLNGNGRPDPGEFLQPPNTRHVDGQVWWVDTSGDIWQIAYYADKENSIHFRRYRFQGFDSFGAPLYDYSHVDHYNVTSELTDVDKIAFFPDESDGGTLFLGGSSTGTGAFTKIARYDHWDHGNRKATWVADLPWDPDPNNTWAPNSFAVTVDYIFVDFWIPHYIEVYSAQTGQYVGRIQPGDNVGGVTGVGNTDEPQSIEAYRRPNGEYIITQEEDYQAKILMYRWTPTSIPSYPTPAPPTNLTATSGLLPTLSWTGSAGDLAYDVWRSTGKGTPYTLAYSGVAASTLDLSNTGLTIGNTYYYAVSAITEIGLTGLSEPIAIKAEPQGTAYPAADAQFTSPAFTVGCPLCFGGQRVGDVAPGVTITFNNITAPVSGTYAVRLYYVNGSNPWSTSPPMTDPPPIYYSVNGSAAVAAPPLTFTGDWNTPGYVTVNITLNAGTNVVVLSNPNSTGTADIVGLLVPPSPM